MFLRREIFIWNNNSLLEWFFLWIDFFTNSYILYGFFLFYTNYFINLYAFLSFPISSWVLFYTKYIILLTFYKLFTMLYHFKLITGYNSNNWTNLLDINFYLPWIIFFMSYLVSWKFVDQQKNILNEKWK